MRRSILPLEASPSFSFAIFDLFERGGQSINRGSNGRDDERNSLGILFSIVAGNKLPPGHTMKEGTHPSCSSEGRIDATFIIRTLDDNIPVDFAIDVFDDPTIVGTRIALDVRIIDGGIEPRRGGRGIVVLPPPDDAPRRRRRTNAIRLESHIPLTTATEVARRRRGRIRR